MIPHSKYTPFYKIKSLNNLIYELTLFGRKVGNTKRGRQVRQIIRKRSEYLYPNLSPEKYKGVYLLVSHGHGNVINSPFFLFFVTHLSKLHPYDYGFPAIYWNFDGP